MYIYSVRNIPPFEIVMQSTTRKRKAREVGEIDDGTARSKNEWGRGSRPTQ